MPHLPATRHSLLLALARRSDDAWEEFLGVYERALLAYCRGLGLQDADARDVAQDVLTAVHARLTAWDPGAHVGSFRGWLFRVARNVAVDRLTGDARRRGLTDEAAGGAGLAELAAPPTEDEAAFDLELRRQVLTWASARARGEVRARTWQAFHLAAVEGLPAAEVAARLGVPLGTVYTARCRVVARIRAHVEALGAEERPPGA